MLEILGAPVGKSKASDQSSEQAATDEALDSTAVTTPCSQIGAGGRILGSEMAEKANERLAKHIESSCKKPTDTEVNKQGCGLAYLVPRIKEHYDNEKTRHNQLPTRLIGDQAISLARYGYRLIDGIRVT